MTPEEERSGDLLDVQLADEIELVSDLVVAASSSSRHLTPEEIDQLLGIQGDTAPKSKQSGQSPAGPPA